MNRVFLWHTDAGRSAAWRLLERVVGPLPAVERGAHGKPYFPGRPGLQFNLSHTAGAVACAVSDSPCGVDIEPEQRVVNLSLTRRFFSDGEAFYVGGNAVRFLEVWTGKEALIKRSGILSCPLRELETLGCPDLTIKHYSSYVVSFCGKSQGFQFFEYWD